MSAHDRSVTYHTTVLGPLVMFCVSKWHTQILKTHEHSLSYTVKTQPSFKTIDYSFKEFVANIDTSIHMYSLPLVREFHAKIANVYQSE